MCWRFWVHHDSQTTRQSIKAAEILTILLAPKKKGTENTCCCMEFLQHNYLWCGWETSRNPFFFRLSHVRSRWSQRRRSSLKKRSLQLRSWRILDIHVSIYSSMHPLIYLNLPLVHKNVYHFFSARFQKMCPFKGLKKKGVRSSVALHSNQPDSFSIGSIGHFCHALMHVQHAKYDLEQPRLTTWVASQHM